MGSRAPNLAAEVKHLRSRKWTQATHPSDSVDTETFARSHPPRIYQSPNEKVTWSNSCHACWKQVLDVLRYRHPGTQREKKKNSPLSFINLSWHPLSVLHKDFSPAMAMERKKLGCRDEGGQRTDRKTGDPRDTLLRKRSCEPITGRCSPQGKWA